MNSELSNQDIVRIALTFGFSILFAIETNFLISQFAGWMLLLFFGSRDKYLTIQLAVTTQICASPISQVTLTQAFVIFWLLNNFLKLKQVKISKQELLGVGFLMTALMLSSIVNHSSDALDLFIYIVFLYLISGVVVNDGLNARGVSLAIIFGSMTAAMPAMFDIIGIEFYSDARMTEIQTAERGGLKRFAAGLGDFNYIGACILVGYAACLSQVLKELNNTRQGWTQLLLWTCMICVFAYAAIATLSRSAIAGIFLVPLYLASLHLVTLSNFSSRAAKKMFVMTFLILLFMSLNYQLIIGYVNAISTLSFEISEDSRFGIFQSYFDAITREPIFGNHNITDELGIAAHNTFIEFAAKYGIISLGALFVLLTLAVTQRTRFSERVFSPVFVSFLFSIYSLITLSLIGWKIFWLLLFLNFRLKDIERRA